MAGLALRHAQRGSSVGGHTPPTYCRDMDKVARRKGMRAMEAVEERIDTPKWSNRQCSYVTIALTKPGAKA